LCPRASAEKIPGRWGQRKKNQKIAKRPKDSTIKPLPGEGATEKRPKIAKKAEK